MNNLTLDVGLVLFTISRNREEIVPIAIEDINSSGILLVRLVDTPALFNCEGIISFEDFMKMLGVSLFFSKEDVIMQAKILHIPSIYGKISLINEDISEEALMDIFGISPKKEKKSQCLCNKATDKSSVKKKSDEEYHKKSCNKSCTKHKLSDNEKRAIVKKFILDNVPDRPDLLTDDFINFILRNENLFNTIYEFKQNKM